MHESQSNILKRHGSPSNLVSGLRDHVVAESLADFGRAPTGPRKETQHIFCKSVFSHILSKKDQMHCKQRPKKKCHGGWVFHKSIHPFPRHHCPSLITYILPTNVLSPNISASFRSSHGCLSALLLTPLPLTQRLHKLQKRRCVISCQILSCSAC